MAVREIVLTTLSPDLSSVLGRLGYNPNKTQIDETMRDQIVETIRWAAPFIRPKAHVMETSILKKSPDTTTLEGGLQFKSSKVAALLSNATSASLMVCTIGNDLKDETDKAIKAGEMTRAVILDAIASEAVEALADHVTEVLAREHRLRGLKPTMRFSPGYGDLKTDVHDRLLPLLEAEKIGVSCHPENFILKPEKSISALIGWIK